MTSNLGLVPHASQRCAHELATHGPRDGLAERCLAHTRRPQEAEDGTLGVLHQAPDRQVFENPLLDAVEVVVVLVQNGPGVLDVEVIVALGLPGQIEDPLHVGSDHGALRGVGGQRDHAADLPLRHLAHRVRQRGPLDPLMQLVPLRGLVVRLAQLLADLAQLLAQQGLALSLIDLACRALGKALGDLCHANLAYQVPNQNTQPRQHIGLCEQRHLLFQ